VAFYIVMLGLVGGILGIFVGLPTVQAPVFNTFTIPVGPLWPMLFVTIACGACSGWHSLVSTSGTCRQLECETDGRPVLAGSMYVEMILGWWRCRGHVFPVSGAPESRTAVFATGLQPPEHIGLPIAYKDHAMIIILHIMQLVLRFMKVATIELVGDYTPIMRNGPIATGVAALLTLLIIQTGWWQYLWVLFGGANQLLASLALLVASLWLRSQGKKFLFALIPMYFMFVTTTAPLYLL
jgi:carbon starvation protein